MSKYLASVISGSREGLMSLFGFAVAMLRTVRCFSPL